MKQLPKQSEKVTMDIGGAGGRVERLCHTWTQGNLFMLKQLNSSAS